MTKLLSSIIISLLLLSCNHNSAQLKPNNVITITQNTDYSITSNGKYRCSIRKISNDSLLVIFSEKGTTFTDPKNYDSPFERSLIFKVPRNFKCLEYENNDLTKLKASFFINIFGKQLIKNSALVNKGHIKICKNEDDTIQINLSVDTGFEFGSIISKSKSRWINSTQNNITINEISNI